MLNKSVCSEDGDNAEVNESEEIEKTGEAKRLLWPQVTGKIGDGNEMHGNARNEGG
jgi:hypothetical protein